jgi:hypothetical protein
VIVLVKMEIGLCWSSLIFLVLRFHLDDVGNSRISGSGVENTRNNSD